MSLCLYTDAFLKVVYISFHGLKIISDTVKKNSWFPFIVTTFAY